MEVIEVGSFQEFEEKLRQLHRQRDERRASSSYVSPLLYRGHCCSDWSLKTTLEREYPHELTLPGYYELASAVRPEVEAFTSKQWDIPSLTKYMEWAHSKPRPLPGDFPGYDYLVYLRHHGFPSPLLDWTRSPYVAAFFAFRHAPISDHVAIYAFLEYPGGGKIWGSDESAIHGLGPYVRSHRRHFLQRSEYTICVAKRDEELVYAPHHSAIEVSGETQNLTWKFTIPSSERMNVLQKLDEYNLNAFSLFGSEESLLETAAMREFYFSERAQRRNRLQ